MEFLLTLGAGVVGGLILNVMPCVLPGLFMKARSVISQLQSGQQQADQRMEGIAYLLGSLATFTAFALMVITLRASGQSLGWGMQMQNPVFVGVLIVVTFLFGLSCFDLLSLNLGVTVQSSKRSKHIKSFLDGVFITLISTPCSAPILGGAVTVALANESMWWETLSLFWSIGFGLCLPILAISFYPKASRWVPRHGAWMDQFKTLVGITLMAVCIWLYTIYEQQLINPDQAPRILYALCGIAGLFVVARLWSQSPVTRRRGLNYLVLVIGGLLLYWSSQAPVEYLDWRPYERASLEAELKAGHPVFLDFTADWCVSCKTFEEFYLNTPSTAQVLRDKNVVSMQVDLTSPDSPYWELLKSFNRTGIPAYVLYPLDGEPELLPEGPPSTLHERVKALKLPVPTKSSEE